MTTRVTAPPDEGHDGLWSQAWAPLCRSGDVAPESVLGVSWLGGRVVVWRDVDGTAHVHSAYCPHFGADLSVGRVVGRELRCAFHHWDYRGDGRLVRTGSGDPPPPGACLYTFPAVERWGLVWAYNGMEPPYEVPTFDAPEHALHWKTVVMADGYALDPWVFLCNTLDFNHLKVVHRLRFEHDDPDDDVEWTRHGVRYRLRGVKEDTGDRTDYRLGVIGTNVFWLSGTMNARPMHFMMPFRSIGPRRSMAYGIVATDRDSCPASEAEAWLDACLAFERRILLEDAPIVSTIRFRPGALTRSDRQLVRFLEYLRAFPRGNDSASAIS
jgi:nitrite reductase/ring-hydroxylating ferredoxin subunit